MSTQKIIRARNLRKQMTDAELKLWEVLRKRQIEGLRFRRQAPIGNYIADFVSYDIYLIIEIDGGQHDELHQIKYDTDRTRWFESQGYTVLRFWNNEVLLEFDTVLDKIWDICNSRTPHPNLPPRYRGGKGLKDEIVHAVEILKQGGLVAFPTETVYGLGADAGNALAIQKIFKAKNRPKDHPLIVHLANSALISDWAVEIPAFAWQLANRFWPGPLTLILKKAPHVSTLLTGGQETIGLRVPNHPVALELLKQFGGGLAGPSANRFQKISPTTCEAVKEELGKAIDFVLDGGSCQVGVESTILDVSGDVPQILRPGMISGNHIEEVLKISLGKKNAASPRVSGSHALHYAPRTKTRVMMRDELLSLLQTEISPCACLLLGMTKLKHEIILMPDNPKEYAHLLYRTLRDIDKKNFSQILIESLPEGTEWDAIRDRLERASS